MIRMIVLIGMMLMVQPFSAAAMAPMVEKSELAGKPAPEFTLPLLKGGQASLTQLRNGKPSILFFWATWCPHCHEELDRLKTTLPSMESKGIRMILIDIGEEAEEVQKFLDRSRITMDVVLDTQETLGEPYQLIGVPTFVFIDASGIVKNTTHELPKDFDQLLK